MATARNRVTDELVKQYYPKAKYEPARNVETEPERLWGGERAE